MKTKTFSKISIFGLMLLALFFFDATITFAQTAAPKGNGKIAFVSWKYDGHERSGVSVMNPDGSGRASLTATQILCPQPNRPPGYGCGPDQLDQLPAWSPDGTQIAFNRSVPVPVFSSETGIFVMNADGSNQRRLTPDGTRVSFPSRPAWSPDGTRIAFVGPHVGDYLAQVYVMNADGRGQRPIGRGIDPAWSPDGSKLAFSWGGLHLMNPDGSGRTQITTPQNHSPNLSDYDWQPAWSPDGTRIVFRRSAGCDWAGDCESITTWTVNADGSNPAKLADIEAYSSLAWSPDGTKIVFSANGDLFTMEADGSRITNITNTPDDAEGRPSWQAVALAPPPSPNQIDEAQFFVRQHYRDFLNREADPEGLAFWMNEITSCSGDQRCIEVKRINDSGSFFHSIEFQETGYLVYRMYKAAHGDLPNAPVPIKLDEFLPDTQRIGQGVIVRQAGWAQVLENNKRNFALEFVQRQRFTSAFSPTTSAAEFVDKLNQNAGNPLSQTERDHLVSDLSSGARSRADVLRAVAENRNLAQAEFNRAFVLMQYFGYLRRNPNDAPDGNFVGYDFWLNKLDQFNGNFIDAEMVKAFLSSSEYRRRFGP